MNYIDFLNDPKVVEAYQKIDETNTEKFNHGMKHVKNVCNIMNDLCTLFNIEKEEKEALMIAAALHDIGIVEGRDNHAAKSRKYIEENFSDELQNNRYYNEILTAIESHSDIREGDTFFTQLLQAADKFDFTKNRLEDNYREKYEYIFTEEIESINFIYDETYFGIDIVMNEIDNFAEKFCNHHFFQKVIKLVSIIAKEQDRIPVIMKNGKIVKEVNFDI